MALTDVKMKEKVIIPIWFGVTRLLNVECFNLSDKEFASEIINMFNIWYPIQYQMLLLSEIKTYILLATENLVPQK